METALIISAAVIVILLIAAVIIAEYGMNTAVKRRKHEPTSPEEVAASIKCDLSGESVQKMHDGVEWFLSQEKLEKVKIKSRDGLTLSGRYLPREGARRTVMLVHGYRSKGILDFSPALRFYHDSGCNILLIDQRSHGESEGKYIGYGALERFDILEWVKYLDSRPDRLPSIYLDGISMGAATVMMAANVGLPSSVVGIIADCGYTSPKEIIAHVARGMHVPYFPAIPILSLACRIRAGYFLGSVSTLDTLKDTDIPFLFVHGEADDFVPVEMSHRNYAACGSKDKRLITVPGAGHGQSYIVDTDGCENALREFFAEHDAVQI